MQYRIKGKLRASKRKTKSNKKHTCSSPSSSPLPASEPPASPSSSCMSSGKSNSSGAPCSSLPTTSADVFQDICNTNGYAVATCVSAVLTNSGCVARCYVNRGLGIIDGHSAVFARLHAAAAHLRLRLLPVLVLVGGVLVDALPLQRQHSGGSVVHIKMSVADLSECQVAWTALPHQVLHERS